MPAASLPTSGWLPYNHAVLADLLVGAKASSAPTAVFDWDNTCILGDIGDHVFVRQLELGAFALSAEQAADRLARWPQVPAADIADIADAWRTCTALAGPGGPHGRWAARAPAAHIELRARLGWAVQYTLSTAGEKLGEAFLWQAGWLDGLSEAALAALVSDAWKAGLARPLQRVTWQTLADAGRQRSCDWQLGLRRCPQMEALMAALTAAGVACWVVTASHQAVVRALVAAAPSLGDGALSPGRVVGMQPQAVKGHAPTTWRAGKVEAIIKHLPTPPLLVAGDAETDFEMLTAFTPPCLSLVIHRDQPAPMDALYARAAAAAAAATTPAASAAGWLLQGRDETTGALVASHWRQPRATGST